MKKFKLKIDLLRSTPVCEGGFEHSPQFEEPSRLILQTKIDSGDRTFYLAGRSYSFRSEADLRRWLDGFSDERVGDWAKGMDGDLVTVVVDRKERKAYLISDRNGAARAYYSNQDGTLSISNSYQDLAKLMSKPRLSSFAVYQLLTLSWVLDPYALIDGAATTRPGEIILFTPQRTTVSEYYRPVQLDARYYQSESECVSALDESFRAVFQKRYTPARQPCVLLSGGIDSVTMLKYAGQAAGGPIHTLTFNVGGVQSDDVEAARIMTRHTRSIHHQITIQPPDAAKLWTECLSREADTSNSSAILTLFAQKYLASLGGKFDVYAGEDTRLHTPSFDYPKELGIRINRGLWRRSRVLRLALAFGSAFQRWWPFIGKNYMRYWLDHLNPAESLGEFALEGLMGFHLPDGWAPEKQGYYGRALEELPKIQPDEGMQGIYKKYVSFMYRTQYTDDMNCVVTSTTGPATELHLPFYDWQDVDVSNRIPYRLAMRSTMTVRSWDRIPFVRKRILRALLKDFAPKEVLYRAKATVTMQHKLFDSPLRDLTRLMLEKWADDLVNAVDPEVGKIIRACVRAFVARDVFEASDDRVLWWILQVAYLALLNQVCGDQSFDSVAELEPLLDRATRSP